MVHSTLMILLICINIELSKTHLSININFILLQTIKNIRIETLQIMSRLFNRQDSMIMMLFPLEMTV
jgi:hypothetical protein